MRVLLAALLLCAAARAAVAQTPTLFGFGLTNQIDAGGPTVTLPVTGRGFVNGAVGLWGATPLPTAFVDSEHLQVTLSNTLTALSAEVNVSVRNPNGATSESYVFYVEPVLLTVGPSVPKGPQSAVITATGRGFVPTNSLELSAGPWFGLQTAYISSTTLTAIIPAQLAATSAQAKVLVLNSANKTFSRDLPLIIGTPPILTSLSPTETVVDGPGLTATLTGSGFMSGAAAQWRDSRVPTVFVSSTQLLATIDASLLRRSVIQPNTGAYITIVNPDGGFSTFLPFFVKEVKPVIFGLEPSSVFAGAPAFTLIVTGSGYSASSQVEFNSEKLQTQFLSSTRLSALVPQSLLGRATQASVRVINGATVIDGGVASAIFGFPINPPVLDSIAPTSVKAGAAPFTIAATGAGFFPGHSISWSGSPLATAYVSPTRLTAVVDAARVAAPGSADITVVSPGGAASNRIEFRIDAQPPAITSLTPASIPAGSALFTLSVRGANFVRGAVVQWNGSALPTTFVGPAELTAVVVSDRIAPPGAAAISVATSGGVSPPAPLSVTAALPAVQTGGVGNAFSGDPVIAPGGLVTIYGTALAARAASADAFPLPRTLGGASVAIDGKPAPLLYAGPGQLNLQAPFDLAPGARTVVIDVEGVKSAAIPVTVAEIAPGTLRAPESNHALAVNYPSGALNSAAAPARPGDYVILYVTGQGRVDRPIDAGEAVPDSPPFAPVAQVDARLGGVPAEIAFAGLAPGYAGLLQVNLKIPDIGPGEQILELSIGGVSSNAAVLSVGGPSAP